jgi:hypothetical protein
VKRPAPGHKRCETLRDFIPAWSLVLGDGNRLKCFPQKISGLLNEPRFYRG